MTRAETLKQAQKRKHLGLSLTETHRKTLEREAWRSPEPRAARAAEYAEKAAKKAAEVAKAKEAA